MRMGIGVATINGLLRLSLSQSMLESGKIFPMSVIGYVYAVFQENISKRIFVVFL